MHHALDSRRMETTYSPTDLDWWQKLAPYWKQAFNQAFLGKKDLDSTPSADELRRLRTAPALRFAGPRAPYPNMQFELPNLSGLEELTQVEILVVSHQQVTNLRGIERLTRLKSLFLFNNYLSELAGIENLTHLEELYIQHNVLKSLAPLKNIVKLHTLYCSGNELSSFEGITPAHAKTMKKFHCLPNDLIPQKEIIRLENRLGIRCQNG